MPRIFDNIDSDLLPALQETISLSDRADFCVGYFNLRGWRQIDSFIDHWSGGDGHCCRLLVGMQSVPADELREAMSLSKERGGMDNQTAIRIKKRLVEEFRDQLAVGIPTNDDEIGLRRLASQIKGGKVAIKLYLRHALHAKLYLLFRPDPINPKVGFLGSSNLTFAGLSKQGELNIDVLDDDACSKLAAWFEDRWNDKWCLDISRELVSVIEESWASEDPLPPYYIYVKMAYHLAQEARAGLSEFRIPKDFGNKLFEFQSAAVKIAAHHLNKRGGVLIGDVVGLGKTLMAAALARVFEDDHDLETLIVCPKNLVSMWEDYRDTYRLRAKVLSITRAVGELPELRRYRLVVIDESHNLRNPEGKRYRALKDYIGRNGSKCILLSATPYNKNYLDLAGQLGLFLDLDKDIGIRPERLLRDMGEMEFIRRHQCSVRSLAAFEKSPYADDWRELMRLYMVRRTRSFIQDNYAKIDSETGRKFLTFADGSLSYFPTRVPRTVGFAIDNDDPADQYARLYSDDVVRAINDLCLPRYGLGNYLTATPHEPPSQAESKILHDLARAGKRLMGFSRTNLFKRLESSGYSFILSVRRHILRNYVYLHAIEHNEPIPIGTQDVEMLDARYFDEDADDMNITTGLFEDENGEDTLRSSEISLMADEGFRQYAKEVYHRYRTQYKKRFRWLRPGLFEKALAQDLMYDSNRLLDVLKAGGEWDAAKDSKLEALHGLIAEKHADAKIIVFSQFADTVRYLEGQLTARGVTVIAGVTGDSADPTAIAWRFSPVSNNKRDRVKPEEDLRVLIATDVLSEGQNLQDCSIIVNYDLPWAIIRLIQRAGRVDRIGQLSPRILCYSFLPAEGVERIIRLRARVRSRLRENAEVVGTDEAFFEDDRNDEAVLDLYNEKAGILDGDMDGEVDLASYAYQIWKNAVAENPGLQKIIPALQPVVYSTRRHEPSDKAPEGVLIYLKTADDNDALAWIDKNGQSVTESQFAILRAAECSPDTTPISRDPKHHELVKEGVALILDEEKFIGGQLGRPSGARFRTYERLKKYADSIKDTLFDTPDLHKAIEDIYRYPLRPGATDTLNRQLKAGISDEELTKLVLAIREENRLCVIKEEAPQFEPRIICSLGLFSPEG
ncbi:MAG: ATP-dependent helicase HepA [Syntrophorhabdus sp. PtaU1.Bin050]|nr:MAG: ATP-dependent helicase HepA [Syntrophorhabdus sp. PtaU1.Bin050]